MFVLRFCVYKFCVFLGMILKYFYGFIFKCGVVVVKNVYGVNSFSIVLFFDFA